MIRFRFLFLLFFVVCGFATHAQTVAFEFSDGIAVVNNGRIAACDTPENICTSGIVKEIFGTELRYSETEGTYYYKYRL